MASGDLLSDTGFACSARIRNAAIGHRHPGSSFSTPVGRPPASRSLDDADLALCFRDGGLCLFHALQMVPAVESCARSVVDL